MRSHNFGPSNTLSHLCVYNHWHSLGGRWTGALDFIMQCARPNHNLTPTTICTIRNCSAWRPLCWPKSSAQQPQVAQQKPSCFSHCLGDYTVFAHMWLAILESANFATSNLCIQISPVCQLSNKFAPTKRQAKRVPSKALDRVASTKKHHIPSRPANSSFQGKFRGPPRNAIETRKIPDRRESLPKGRRMGLWRARASAKVESVTGESLEPLLTES